MDQKNEFPGYPQYPADEDITRAKNNTGKIPVGDVKKPAAPFNDTVDEQDPETNIVAGTDADITDEDLRILESTGQNMSLDDDNNLIHASLDDVDDDGEPLNEESAGDASGDDLDVPGSEDDDEDEAIGEEDEENNYYSLGGDNHEGQEENKGE